MTGFEPLKRLVVFGFALLGLAQAVSAQPQPASGGIPEIEVRDVKFSSVRAPGGGADSWYEAAIELTVRGDTTAGATSRFVDRVQVSLALGVRTRAGEFDFYRSSAEAVSLEAGRAVVRFYLPPEITKRDQISGEPHAFAIDIAVRGRPLSAGPAASAAVVRSPEALRSFKDRVMRAAPLNDGVLVPQFESPFAPLYAGDTPSFVRRPR